jgi:hypothetical protein
MTKKYVTTAKKNEAQLVPNPASMQKIAKSFDKVRARSMQKNTKNHPDFVEVKISK